MHFTGTQQSGAEYDSTRGSDEDANGGGRDSVPAPNEQISTRMERKTQRRVRRVTATSSSQDPYTQDSINQDHHTQGSYEPGYQSDGYDEFTERHHSDDAFQHSGGAEDIGGNFDRNFDDAEMHAQGAAAQRPSRRRKRNTRRSGVGEEEGVKWQDVLPDGGELSRRSIKWRELLRAKHSVTESGFPIFAGMKPVVAFLTIPGLIVIGITLTGGHWPKELLYPLALAMGIYVMFSALRGVELVLAVLLLYVQFSPVYVIPLAPGINGTNALIGLGLMATIVQARTHGIGWFNWKSGTTMIFIYAIITTMSGLTIMFQPDGKHYLLGDEFHNYKGWIEQFIVYFIALSCIRDHATAKRIYFYMCIGSVLVVLYTLPEMYSKMGLSSIEKSRVNGPLAQANEFGGLLAYTMMFTGGLFLAYIHTFRAWVTAPYFLLALKLLISTFSRGAYLALAVGGIFAGYLRGKVFFFASVFAALVFFAVLPQFIPGAIVDRMSASLKQTEATSGPTQLDKSSEHRLILWKAAADMTLESPLTGKGFKGFQKMKHLYTERPVHEKDPHNYYLYVSSQMGLPALVIFFFILTYAFYMGWRLSKNKDDTYIRAMGISGASAVVTYAAVCMFGSRATNPEFTAYFWVMVACMQVLIAPDNQAALTRDGVKHEQRRQRLGAKIKQPSPDDSWDAPQSPDYWEPAYASTDASIHPSEAIDSAHFEQSTGETGRRGLAGSHKAARANGSNVRQKRQAKRNAKGAVRKRGNAFTAQQNQASAADGNSNHGSSPAPGMRRKRGLG